MRLTRRVCSCSVFAAALVVASDAPALAQTAAAEVVPSAQVVRPGGGDASGTGLGDVIAASLVDFTRLPSRDTATLITIGALAAGFGHAIDDATSRRLSGARTLDAALDAGETIGGARAQLAAAIGTYVAGQVSGSSKVAQIGADLMRAQILSQAITASIKLSVRRGRPDGTRYSFPSGHSSVTFATATVLQRDLGWKVGVPAYALATYVAASRIQDRRHFLSDVAFGAAIGIAAGRTVTIGRGDAQFAMSPMAASGGAGVSFTWVGSR